MNIDTLIVFRPMFASDEALVICSWMASQGVDVSRRRHLSPQECRWLRAGIRAHARALLADGAVVTVAAYREDPNVIVAWACRSGTVLDFVYVKREYRRLGIATRLVTGCESASAKTSMSLQVPALARLPFAPSEGCHHGDERNGNGDKAA